MSNLAIELHWQRAEPGFQPGKYSAEHLVRYNNTYEVQVDAAPGWGGKPENTNPEQALASALSRCHMMTFLALAAKAGWPVANYHGNPPFLTGCGRRTHAAIFSFMAGVMPPMPRCPAMVCLQTMKGMLGRSLL
jgi:hypothetical protein